MEYEYKYRAMVFNFSPDKFRDIILDLIINESPLFNMLQNADACIDMHRHVTAR